MAAKDELNTKLLEACIAEPVDYELIESLLKQGAEPLGKIESYLGLPNNLYDEVIDEFYLNESVPEDLYQITDLFLRYGMDISKPAIPYDHDNVLHPLWTFAFPGNEVVLRTLKLLLDHGLSAEDASYCWGHAIEDYCNVDGELKSDWQFEAYYDYLRKLMLIASYPHVLDNDEWLRKEIWYDYNDYDLVRFRNWNDFTFDVDTSRCQKGYPNVYHSLVTIRERATGKAVWKYGVSFTPDDTIPGHW